VFDRESLEVVTEYGIAVNCGSTDMLAQYAERAPGGEVTLRVNPGFGHGHSKKTNTGGEHSKHGIWHEDLPRALELAARAGVRVTGLHLHIGSGADLEHLALVAGAAEKLAAVVGRSLHTLSAGGGLPIPYRTGDVRPDIGAYFRIWDAARKRTEATLGRRLRLEIEPGRYIVAESGFLIAEVRAVKQIAARTFVLLDAGFNALARPVMYGSYHPMSLAPSDDSPRAERDVVVGGPLCESGDIFTQDEAAWCAAPADARVGDFLVIECAGAYGAMASNYNSKPRPRGDREEQKPGSAARETSADMLRGEVIPRSSPRPARFFAALTSFLPLPRPGEYPPAQGGASRRQARRRPARARNAYDRLLPERASPSHNRRQPSAEPRRAAPLCADSMLLLSWAALTTLRLSPPWLGSFARRCASVRMKRSPIAGFAVMKRSSSAAFSTTAQTGPAACMLAVRGMLVSVATSERNEPSRSTRASSRPARETVTEPFSSRNA
jgi:diaminopimelate decarboxylase